MAGAPLVSVVIPTRDRESFLRRAVASVRAQERDDLELLVIDDGSRSAAEDAIRDLLAPGDRVIRCDPSRGGAAARNRGLAEARGELLAFLDDDDEWLPGKLTRQIDRLADSPPDVAVVYCGYRFLVEATGDLLAAPAPEHRGDVHRICLRRCLTPTSTALIRRRAVEEAGGFDAELKAGQEWDLWIRLSRRGHFDFVPHDLVRLRVHGGQISSGLDRVIAGRKRILQKYRAEYQADPALLADQLHRLGVLEILAGNRAQGRRQILSALRRDPRLSLVFHLLLSFSPPLYRWTVMRFGMFRAGSVAFYH